jgi:hypothetical protein
MRFYMILKWTSSFRQSHITSKINHDTLCVKGVPHPFVVVHRKITKTFQEPIVSTRFISVTSGTPGENANYSNARVRS